MKKELGFARGVAKIAAAGFRGVLCDVTRAYAGAAMLQDDVCTCEAYEGRMALSKPDSGGLDRLWRGNSRVFAFAASPLSDRRLIVSAAGDVDGPRKVALI